VGAGAPPPETHYGGSVCGRFIQYSDPEVYVRRFGVEVRSETKLRYNLAPTQLVLAVRQAMEGEREPGPLRWELVPSWSKGPDNRFSMINTRAERSARSQPTATPSSMNYGDTLPFTLLSPSNPTGP